MEKHLQDGAVRGFTFKTDGPYLAVMVHFDVALFPGIFHKTYTGKTFEEAFSRFEADKSPENTYSWAGKHNVKRSLTSGLNTGSDGFKNYLRNLGVTR